MNLTYASIGYVSWLALVQAGNLKNLRFLLLFVPICVNYTKDKIIIKGLMAYYNSYCALNIFYALTLTVSLALVSTFQKSITHS